MKKHYLLPVVWITFAACHGNNNMTKEEADIAIRAANAAPPLAEQAAAQKTITPTGNALLISEPCAVFYTPDTIKLNKLKQENGEEAFYTIADDNQNYMADSRTFLESKGVKIIEAPSGKITFRHKDGRTTDIHLNEEKYAWEVFLFNGNNLHKADITDMEQEFAKHLK